MRKKKEDEVGLAVQIFVLGLFVFVIWLFFVVVFTWDGSLPEFSKPQPTQYEYEPPQLYTMSYDQNNKDVVVEWDNKKVSMNDVKEHLDKER
jgi:hypothetical protein